MSVLWSYGYHDPFEQIDVPLGTSDTLPNGLRGLLECVRTMADNAEEYEMSNWEALIADISDIYQDVRLFPDNPDMWDEPTIYDTYGIEYYVMHGLDESGITEKLDEIDNLVGTDI